MEQLVDKCRRVYQDYKAGRDIHHYEFIALAESANFRVSQQSFRTNQIIASSRLFSQQSSRRSNPRPHLTSRINPRSPAPDFSSRNIEPFFPETSREDKFVRTSNQWEHSVKLPTTASKMSKFRRNLTQCISVDSKQYSEQLRDLENLKKRVIELEAENKMLKN